MADEEEVTDGSGNTYVQSNVSFDPTLEPLEGEEPLDEQRAVHLLAQRFGLVTQQNTGFWSGVIQGLYPPAAAMMSPSGPDEDAGETAYDEPAKNLLTRMVRMLPTGMRTESVLQYIDLRPVLSELEQTERQASSGHKYMQLGGQTFRPEERVIAGRLLAYDDAAVQAAAYAAAEARNEEQPFTSELERQKFVETFVGNPAESEELGTSPVVAGMEAPEDATDEQRTDLATRQVSLQEELYAEYGLLDGGGTAYAWMPDERVQWMFQMNMVDWNAILDNEAAKGQARAAGDQAPNDMMVDTGGLAEEAWMPQTNQADTATLWSAADSAATVRNISGSSRVRLLDVFNMLFDPTRSESDVRNIQDKLVAAGYIDDEDIQYDGRGYDQATQEAWRQLVVDSVNTGIDMAKLLQDRTISKREEDEEEEAKSLRDIVLSSTPAIRLSSDSLGQQVIGRKLSTDDHARLIEFIHNMEREQQTTLDMEGRQEVESVDMAAEIEQWISDEYSTEAGSYDVLEQFQSFNDIVRQRG